MGWVFSSARARRGAESVCISAGSGLRRAGPALCRAVGEGRAGLAREAPTVARSRRPPRLRDPEAVLGGFRQTTALSCRFSRGIETILLFRVVVRVRNNIWHLVGTE